MAVQSAKYKVDDEVWVPVADVKAMRPTYTPPADAAVVHGKLHGRVDADDAPGVPRTWNVTVNGLTDDAGIEETIEVSSRRFRRYTKILIVRIGDWETEQLTLNPLADSLKAQLSLLLPPGFVDVEYIRTLDELKGALKLHGGGKSTEGKTPWGYAVLVGHGRSGGNAGMNFGGTWCTPLAIAGAIGGLGPGRKSFSEAKIISVCCHTGDPSFAETISDTLNSTFVGPSESVHSYEAAAFVLRLFYEHFLQGRLWSDAFRETCQASATFSTRFRCWRDGSETHVPA
jgi:hypothetical protein